MDTWIASIGCQPGRLASIKRWIESDFSTETCVCLHTIARVVYCRTDLDVYMYVYVYVYMYVYVYVYMYVYVSK